MESKQIIDAILIEASKAAGKDLEITSSLRTPYAQASAMYPHFETNSPTLRSYASFKKEMLKEIEDAYKKGKKENKDKKSVINLMASTIQAQVKNNKFISNHLSNSARDIRTRNLSSDEIQKLKTFLKTRRDILVLDERSTISPHIHIHMK